MNILHHSSAFIAKHKRHHHIALATLALVIAGTGVYTYRHELAQAATFTFTQASWVGGASATLATHANNNQSGWTYSSSTPATNITEGTTLTLPSISYAFTDDGATSTTPTAGTSGGGFANGAYAMTLATTTASGASIGLGGGINGGTGADGAVNLASSCTGTGITGTWPNCTITTTSNPFNYTTFNLPSGVILSATGTLALIIRATGDVTIAGRLTATSTTAIGLAGGYDRGAGVGVGGAGVSCGAACGAGGGGGGYGAIGGTGGISGAGGAGGVSSAEDPTTTTPPMGGGGSAAGAGGASGGNVKIESLGSVSITSSGVISVTGVKGGDYSSRSAGGGGSGGRVYIQANSVTHAGLVDASGGAGGTGSSGRDGGGGGGGRVYLYYLSSLSNTGTISMAGGVGGGSNLNPGSTNPSFTTGTPPAPPYASSGTFTSAVIDLGASADFTSKTFAWTETLPTGGQTITMKARSSNSATMVGATAFASCGTIAKNAVFSTQSPSCVTNGHRYVQYEATLNTNDTTVTPTLDSVTINYSQYAASGDLTSSIYDIGSNALVSRLTWAGATTSTETIQFQVQSSADNITWSGWCGYSETGTTCDGSKYFTDANNGVTLGTSHPLRSTAGGGAADRYFQYKVFLGSGGGTSPTLTSVTVQYVVNAPPVVGNILPAQITDSASANYNKVAFTYDVSDSDTDTGATYRVVTPTLYEYFNGTSWVTIASGLSANAYSTIALTGNSATSTSPTVTWDPSGTNVYSTGAKIRVTITDSEGANFSAVATSGTFTLDSKPPVVSYVRVDSSTANNPVTWSTTDDTALSYRLSNSAFASYVSNEATWTATTTGANGINWPTLTGTPNAETVYYQFRDAYGNGVSGTAVAPAVPSNFITTDTTNLNAGVYREFLSWGVATSSGFGSYKVYYNTTGAGSSYSLLSTITDVNQNYYTDTITGSATSSTHYYKMVTVSANGDISEFSPIKSDVPDGSGSTDVSPPYIPLAGIAVATVWNTSAHITFSTYTDISMANGELATSTVYYGSYTGSVPSSCPSALISTNTYTVNHSIYITGLTPATDYYFCVRAKDMADNTSALDVSVGGTFRTVSGPIITNVTEREITDTSALIFWNTDTSSDSKVYFATTQSGVDTATPVTGALVTTAGSDGAFQHQVGLTGLTSGLTYYFMVSSTDASTPTPLTSSDDRSDQYYSFVTLRDTTPPTITGIATPVLAPDATVIVWQTDEPATSQIQWGTASSTYTHSTIQDTGKSIYHIVTLSSSTNDMTSTPQTLTPETTYHFKVISNDAAGNSAESGNQSFLTPSSGNVTITVVNVVNSASAGDTTKDTTPPSISNVTVGDITPFGATVKFGTSEDADAFVKFGKDISYGDVAGDDAWGTTHTVKLHGLTLGTDYHIMVTAHDKAGNTGTSADQTFKTTFLSENLKDMANVENIEQFQKEIESAIESILPSLVPPFVTKPVISDITESGATVSFKTNIKAFPVVVYAEDGAYDETKDNPYTGEVSDTVTKDTTHTLKLTGLKGNTKYHVQARGFSLPKVIGKSADVTFITKASKIAGSIVERKKDSFTVVWTTDQPTTSIVEFKDLKRGITERKVDEAKKTSHSMKIENLPSGTAYEVNLSGMTEQGNIAEAGSPLSVTTSTDTTPPTISGFKVDNALVPGRTDRIQTIVSWVTDEPSNSTVYFEEGAGTAGDTTELANKNEVLDSYVTGHSVILPSLKPGTIYRLKVTSSDDSGNLGSFGPRTVITPQQTASITDIIFKNFEDSFKFLRKI